MQHSGCDSVMVWGCFDVTKTSKLSFLAGRQDGSKYFNTLKEFLLLFEEDLPLTSTFMQYVAPFHRTILDKRFGSMKR